MAERGWENVWAEIVAKAREHWASGEPVRTLGRDVPNEILEVTATRLRRRSAQPRSSQGDSDVSSTDVRDLWQQLVEKGQALQGGQLAFSYALVARFIDGVDFSSSPLSLKFADRDRAMTVWAG